MKRSFDTDFTDALKKAQRLLAPEYPDIQFKITEIDGTAINYWCANWEWMRAWGKKTYGWNVIDKNANPLTIAVYANDQLCALAAANIEPQKQLSLNMVESHPDPGADSNSDPDQNPLKGITIAIITKIIEVVALEKGVYKIVIDPEFENDVSSGKIEENYRKSGYNRPESRSRLGAYFGGNVQPLQKILQIPSRLPKRTTSKNVIAWAGVKSSKPAPP